MGSGFRAIKSKSRCKKEIHTVNQPIPVEKPYNVPYDVIKHVEKVVEVPTPVHVAKPVPYDVPTPVVGKLTLEKRVAQYFFSDLCKSLRRMLQASSFRSKKGLCLLLFVWSHFCLFLCMITTHAYVVRALR